MNIRSPVPVYIFLFKGSNFIKFKFFPRLSTIQHFRRHRRPNMSMDKLELILDGLVLEQLVDLQGSIAGTAFNAGSIHLGVIELGQPLHDVLLGPNLR